MGKGVITVEVVYAAVDAQALLVVDVPEGSTVMTAVEASGIARRFSDLQVEQSTFGIFGKVVSNPQGRVLQQGDRVEIYRPLLADPKEIRRLRAERAAKLKKDSRTI